MSLSRWIDVFCLWATSRLNSPRLIKSPSTNRNCSITGSTHILWTKYQIVSYLIGARALFNRFLDISADPDGNVIFELNKLEIDDAHKDKQKMFRDDFKVNLTTLSRYSNAIWLSPFQIHTVFQRVPNGVNHHQRLQINNMNGIPNDANPREPNYGFINRINNNASTNINNNINPPSSNHIVAEPQLQPSQSSDNGRLQGIHFGQPRYQTPSTNDNPRLSENFQTTSEGSTTPESSSESSEEWESGELKWFNIA